MTVKFVLRNLQLFAKDQSAIFFSFLGMLIGLGTYLAFLRSELVAGLVGIKDGARFMDTWMVAGLVAIVATTSALPAFGRKIVDENLHLNWDLMVNTRLSARRLRGLYVVTSLVQGGLQTTVFLGVCYGFLGMIYHYNPFTMALVSVWVCAMVLVACCSLLFALIMRWVGSINGFAGMSAIVGSLAGFLVGTYIPYGQFPRAMQMILQYYPGFQLATLMRTASLQAVAVKLPAVKLAVLGISNQLGHVTLVTLIFLGVLLGLNLLLPAQQTK